VWIHLVPARSGLSGLLPWCLPFDFSHRQWLLHVEFTDQFSLVCFPLLACFLHQSAGPHAQDLQPTSTNISCRFFVIASMVAVLSAGSLSARVSSFQLHPSYCRSHRDQPPPFSFSLRHASLVDFLCGQILQCNSLGQVRGLFFLWPQSLRCPWRSSFSTVRGLSCLAASPTL
jgi:hypothetical protein